VPKGAARLRVTVTSEHSAEEIDRIVLAFERLAQSIGHVPSTPAAALHE
jgi:hypothetical protein